MAINQDLIKQCSEGKRKAQHELYKLCFAPLISICFRYTPNKDDAAALVNESFFKILSNIDTVQEGTPFLAWARRITINHCIDQYKKDVTRKKYLENVSDPNEIERKPDLSLVEDDSKYSPEMLEKVKSEILNLSPTTQEVFQMFIYEGYSHAEIAEILNMKEGTSKWHVNNARTILREALKKTMKIMSSIAL